MDTSTEKEKNKLEEEWEINREKTLSIMMRYDTIYKILIQAQKDFDDIREELRLADEKELVSFLKLQRNELLPSEETNDK